MDLVGGGAAWLSWVSGAWPWDAGMTRAGDSGLECEAVKHRIQTIEWFSTSQPSCGKSETDTWEGLHGLLGQRCPVALWNGMSPNAVLTPSCCRIPHGHPSSRKPPSPSSSSPTELLSHRPCRSHH